MSTEGQLQGDSLRRQVERSREYAAQHGLDLDETTTFADIGVSAYRGKNLRVGALSHFLEAVRTKKIATGSFLLVESLDRFSRDEVKNALPEFIQLVNAGINVVTLVDGKVFRADQLELVDLMYSLMVLARANDESKHKSDRISQSWANKRANAGRRKIGINPNPKSSAARRMIRVGKVAERFGKYVDQLPSNWTIADMAALKPEVFERVVNDVRFGPSMTGQVLREITGKVRTPKGEKTSPGSAEVGPHDIVFHADDLPTQSKRELWEQAVALAELVGCRLTVGSAIKAELKLAP